jgi:sugar phosphate isomerase/epimerase
MPLPAHLCYCTNIHPGESLDQVQRALREHAVPVKARVAGDEQFDVGLRLSARAASELGQPGVAAEFASELAGAGLCVRTLNGFPYGAFHGTRVKEAVYRPDWQEPARLSYTRDLVRALSALLPEGARGSISTVPGCFAPRLEAEGEALMARALLTLVADLVALERKAGQHIVLALEPEPGCVLETSADVLGFFERYLWRRDALMHLAGDLSLDVAAAEHAVRRHLGVCLDACHASVEHESPLAVYRTLRGAGIEIPKIQVSAGLALDAPGPEELRELARFDEPTYLHQTVVRDGDTLRRYVDLPDALTNEVGRSGDWRVHFHVPVFHSNLGAFGSTQPELRELLVALGSEPVDVQLEVETYTWDVLPKELRDLPLVDAIALEIEWTAAAWGPSE